MIASDAPSSFIAIGQKTREHELNEKLRSGEAGLVNCFYRIHRDIVYPSVSRGSVSIGTDTSSPVSA